MSNEEVIEKLKFINNFFEMFGKALTGEDFTNEAKKHNSMILNSKYKNIREMKYNYCIFYKRKNANIAH